MADRPGSCEEGLRRHQPVQDGSDGRLRLVRTLTQKAPWAVAVGFGLLHGFGFAGALAEVGLPTAEIPLALFSVNVGIELGQLAFVGAVLLFAAALRRVPVAQWAMAVPVYGIWFLQRAASLM